MIKKFKTLGSLKQKKTITMIHFHHEIYEEKYLLKNTLFVF